MQDGPRDTPPSYMDRIAELAKGIDPYRRMSEPAPQQIVPDLSWLDQILYGIDAEECDTGWWETSAGAAFGARRLAELKAEITRRFYHQTTTVHIGAWTTGSTSSGAVRDALANLSPAAREFIAEQSGQPYRFGKGTQAAGPYTWRTTTDPDEQPVKCQHCRYPIVQTDSGAWTHPWPPTLEFQERWPEKQSPGHRRYNNCQDGPVYGTAAEPEPAGDPS